MPEDQKASAPPRLCGENQPRLCGENDSSVSPCLRGGFLDRHATAADFLVRGAAGLVGVRELIRALADLAEERGENAATMCIPGALDWLTLATDLRHIQVPEDRP